MSTAEPEPCPEIDCRSAVIMLKKIHESEFETYKIIVELLYSGCSETDLHNCPPILLKKISSYEKTRNFHH